MGTTNSVEIACTGHTLNNTARLMAMAGVMDFCNCGHAINKDAYVFAAVDSGTTDTSQNVRAYGCR
jgi:hypothetical protein